MTESSSISNLKEHNNEIAEWMSELEKLYAKDLKNDDFKREKAYLEAYLVKLKEETSPSGKLSVCNLKGPYAKGGTGIVFKATHVRIKQELALKFNRPRKEQETISLIENELSVLPLLEHSNIIKVIDVAKFDLKTPQFECPALSILIEPFIPQAINLREYVRSLSLRGTEINEQNIFVMDESLLKLTSVLRQWVEALIYIHKSGFVYLDMKPDNAIVDKNDHLIVIDFGTSQKVDPDDQSSIEIFFSDPYAHPRIKKHAEKTSTNRVKAAIKRSDIMCELDYYALGKSIIELLEIISHHHSHDFPQRPLFQSLHFLATRLLDGQNVSRPGTSMTWRGDELFLGEVFDRLIPQDYATIKYSDLQDVLRDLEKELGNWNPEHVVPELETFPTSTLRVVPDINTTLTKRLISLIEHPLFARLKMINQLGLMTYIYPTAIHTRYDHSLGTYSYTICYIRALFNDSQNCMFRNLINEKDIKAAILAALLHDLGQYPLAHDLQDAQPKIFDHSSFSIELLEDDTKDKDGRTLRDIIQNDDYGWGVELEALKRILQAHSHPAKLLEVPTAQDFKADMLSALIDGPIDADKADYIVRDSISCQISYGNQLDIHRLLNVLTTVRIPDYLGSRHKVTIGIYEKGSASAAAFSLARFLLHASVYWHHASRILKAMLQYGTVMILPNELFAPMPDEGKTREIREKLLRFIRTSMTPPSDQAQQELKPRILKDKIKKPITAEPTSDVIAEFESSKRENMSDWNPGLCKTNWLMLDWLKGMATTDSGARGAALINLILQRRLFKRVYTIRYDKMTETQGLINKLELLSWHEKIRLSKEIQDGIYEVIQKKAPRVDTIPSTSRAETERLFENELVILVDIPNYKKFMPDRPLIYVPELQKKTYYQESPAESYYLDEALGSLMKSISQIRVLCHPQIRQWISIYVSPDAIKDILTSSLAKP